jgi:hypothetical protein
MFRDCNGDADAEFTYPSSNMLSIELPEDHSRSPPSNLTWPYDDATSDLGVVEQFSWNRLHAQEYKGDITQNQCGKLPSLHILDASYEAVTTKDTVVILDLDLSSHHILYFWDTDLDFESFKLTVWAEIILKINGTRHVLHLIVLWVASVAPFWMLQGSAKRFEYLDRRRQPCTTMPWSIWPILVVIWGVCWMYYYPNASDGASCDLVQDYTWLERLAGSSVSVLQAVETQPPNSFLAAANQPFGKDSNATTNSEQNFFYHPAMGYTNRDHTEPESSYAPESASNVIPT